MPHFSGSDPFLVDRLSEGYQLLPYVGIFLLQQSLVGSHALPPRIAPVPVRHLSALHQRGLPFRLSLLAVGSDPQHELGLYHLQSQLSLVEKVHLEDTVELGIQ